MGSRYRVNGKLGFKYGSKSIVDSAVSSRFKLEEGQGVRYIHMTYVNFCSITNVFRAMVVFCVGIFVSKSISIFSGLIIYAKYKDCDPILAGKVKRIDQVVPMFILDMVTGVPGLAGLFVAGIFNTALR